MNPKVVLTALVCITSVESRTSEPQVTLHSDHRGGGFGVSYRHDYRGTPGETHEDFPSSVTQKYSNSHWTNNYPGYPHGMRYSYLRDKNGPNLYYQEGYRYGRYYAYISGRMQRYPYEMHNGYPYGRYYGNPYGRYYGNPYGRYYGNPHGKLRGDNSKNVTNKKQVKSAATVFYSVPNRILKALNKAMNFRIPLKG